MATLRTTAAVRHLASRQNSLHSRLHLHHARPLSATAARYSGKEEKLHTDGRAEEVDQHKHEQLQQQRDGRGEWKDELASNSESIIKAERGEIDASEETISKLQKESQEALKRKK